ncbi:autophagy protein 16 [Xylariomycetidae sp. FL2044]|nr:autophagy protein 16 [Xylariomycetidae sp. FL2044]
MSDWRDDYLKSLQDAERNNPVNKDLVEACSQLADRVAALEAEKAVLQSTTTTSNTTTPSTPQSKSSSPASKPTTSSAPSSSSRAAAADPQLRLDIAEALRSKGHLEARLRKATAELTQLRARTQQDARRIGELTTERNALAGKLRDRSEELAGKNKLLKDVQDDNLTLNIQLDVTEQRAARVAAENRDLVDRWMQRMAKEADALNLRNEKDETPVKEGNEGK